MARQFAGTPGGIGGQKKPWLTLRRSAQANTPAIGAEEARSAEVQSGSTLAGRVQHVTWMEAETHAEAWRDLSERAAAPNAFLEPSFALTAIRHSPPIARPSFLLVWGDDARTRLIGLAAVHFPVSASEPLVTFWNHADTRLGGLLLDDVQDSEALHALVTWLAIEHPALRVLMCAGVRRDSTVSAVLGSPSSRRLRLRVVESSQGRLHAYDPSRKSDPFTENLLVAPSSLARESERGDLRASLEEFLLLDAASDSGGRMPLLDRAGFATFARAVTRQLSRESKCRIERLTLEGRLIASAIMMRSGGENFMWHSPTRSRRRCVPPSGASSSRLHRMMRMRGSAPFSVATHRTSSRISPASGLW
jgi:hypothetical protein